MTLPLRAGAVLRHGYAIVVPHNGDGRAGISRLVGALVSAGAELIGDGEVEIDDRGRVRVPAGAPAAASASADGVDLALIVATTYQAGVSWRPRVLYGARATLPILERAASTRGPLRSLIRLAAQLAPRVTTLSGPRPDAARIAPRILAYLDAMVDGTARERVGAGYSQVPGLEATGVSLARGAIDRASLDLESALLERRPSLLLLHWRGRFGNRMHQYAYGVTYARRTGHRFWLPSQWEGTHLFQTQHHTVLPHGRLRAALTRLGDDSHSPEHRLEAVRAVASEAVLIRPADPGQNYAGWNTTVCVDDLCVHHSSIFAAMSRTHLLSVFELSDRVKGLDLYKRLEDRQGTYDIAHLRRDDISSPAYNRTHVQHYSVVSKRSYERAFAKFGFDPGAVEWVSDDYSGQWHVDRPQHVRGDWRYPTGSEILPGVLFDWLEDFLRLYFARTIFRANSSFSWWAAFLSPGARVFSPMIDKRHIYGVDGIEEIDVEFVEGTHPHWMFNNADIRIGP
jgi:hypothetical protein